MRFSLQDIKKSIHRRGSELSLTLHFLRPGELSSEIDQLIGYHEQLLGQPQRHFSLDDARACIGDYRLAHCLIATLSNWYSWQQREWREVVQGFSESSNLAEFSSPIQLRLALYDYVNQHYSGFLDTQTRSMALEQFAKTYALRATDLEYLLALDSEEEALLVRNTPEPPSSQQVATLYNQWAFEAALFNASNVHFVINCAAFDNAFSTAKDQSVGSAVSTGIGAVIKRLCYLARKLGVYYDLAYEEDVSPQGAEEVFVTSPRVPIYLHLTLYGPQEVTGAPQYYGLRLARLCRMLLGYNTAKTETGRKKGKRPALAPAIVTAEATVHFLQRTYTLGMDTDMLHLIERPGNGGVSRPETSALSENPIFDSSIEESFAQAFTALANSQGADGWRLEREPEPLLLEHSIFIPDFALTRARQRIYVEILGFWTPSYRERKIQKLQQLSGRNDLLLALPVDAKDSFASIIPHFPTVIYNGQLSATEVLQVLRSHYDNFVERLAAIDVAEVRTQVTEKGLLPERICYEILHCYRRSELQRAAEHVISEDIGFLPGLGLYHVAAIEQLKHAFLEWMHTVRSLPLKEAFSEMRVRWPMLVDCEDTTLEALLGLWPEVQIQRSSIFDAVVELTPIVEAHFIAPTTEPSSDVGTPLTVPKQEPKKQVREKRGTLKKRSPNETTQGELWG